MGEDEVGESTVLWEILSAGFSIYALLNAEAGSSLQGGDDEFGILDHLEEIARLIEKFQMERASRRVSNRLDRLRQALSNSDDEILANGLVDQVNLMARDLVRELRREGLERPIFVSMPGRNIQIWELLLDPIEWFGIKPDATLQPPSDAVMDFQEAARAFAAGFAPATIVFALRATEGVLREYCNVLLGEAVRGNTQWGGLTNRLRKSGQCPGHILDRLEALRQRRNDAMHPGQRDPERWDDEAASQVLHECREVIRAMSRHIAQREGE